MNENQLAIMGPSHTARSGEAAGFKMLTPLPPTPLNKYNGCRILMVLALDPLVHQQPGSGA